MALEGSFCTKKAFLWKELTAFGWVLQLTSLPMLLLDFFTELGAKCVLLVQSTWSCLCATIPYSAEQTPLSKAMCWQLGGTKGLVFVPAYRLLFQVSDFARNMTGSEQRCRPRDPLFSWCLSLLLVQMHPLKALGVDMTPSSLAVPWTRTGEGLRRCLCKWWTTWRSKLKLDFAEGLDADPRGNLSLILIGFKEKSKLVENLWNSSHLVAITWKFGVKLSWTMQTHSITNGKS